MTNVPAHKHVSHHLVDAYHCATIWRDDAGRYRWVIETRIGRAVRHKSERSFKTQVQATRDAYYALGCRHPDDRIEE